MTTKSVIPPTKKDKIALVKSLKGISVQTIYGPSTVLGFAEKNAYVRLAEFGEELYLVTLDDFINMYFEYN